MNPVANFCVWKTKVEKGTFLIRANRTNWSKAIGQLALVIVSFSSRSSASAHGVPSHAVYSKPTALVQGTSPVWQTLILVPTRGKKSEQFFCFGNIWGFTVRQRVRAVRYFSQLISILVMAAVLPHLVVAPYIITLSYFNQCRQRRVGKRRANLYRQGAVEVGRHFSSPL